MTVVTLDRPRPDDGEVGTAPCDPGVARELEQLPLVLTVDEVAQLLRVNRKSVYEGVKRGTIPGWRKVGNAIRFHRDALLDWLSCRAPSSQPKGT